MKCLVDDQGIRAEKLDGAWTEIVSSIKLPGDWRRRVEALVSNQDERAAILREREQVQEKIRRLKRLYRDLIIDDVEYQATLGELQARMSTLVLPSSPHLIQAGGYLENLGKLWGEATGEEQMEVTRMLVDELRVDVPSHSIVALKPKAVFRLLFTEICESIGVEVI